MSAPVTPQQVDGDHAPSSATTTAPTALVDGRRRVPQSVWGLLLVLPSAALVVGVVMYPVIYLVRLSLFDAHAYLPRQDFVGLDNYAAALTSTDTFWQSTWLTVVYAGATVALQTALGVAVALLLHQQFRSRGLVRMFAILPYMIPTVVVAIVWRWLFDGRNGAAAYLLSATSLASAETNWLGTGRVFTTAILVSVWTFFPFVMLSVLARLQSIDPILSEAARVDGANAWQRFRHIILPELRSVLITLVILRVMFMFTKFDLLYLFAGSSQETRTLPILTFLRIFGESRLGSGAALAVLMFALLLVSTTFYFWLARRGEAEEAT